MATLSSFTWLDHNDREQERVREVLSAFDQPGMIDPLGFGVVRDAFSDMLFPGISTIQTRARYFLFVPWVFKRLENMNLGSGKGREEARKLEVALIDALLQGSSEREGIIGRDSRGGTKRLPSEIYWGGLGRWGIRKFEGTRQEYLSSVERGYTTQREIFPGLPPEPDGLFNSTTLGLRTEEAEFLRDRILLWTRGSYLEVLVRDGSEEQVGDLPWTHPLATIAPPNLRRRLNHVRLFAHGVQGARILYNDELSKLLETDGKGALSDDYATQCQSWAETMRDMQSEYRSWDRAEMWDLVEQQNPRAVRMRPFVDWWFDTAVADPQRAISSDDVRRKLREREEKMKGPRSKLASRRAREQSPVAQGDQLMTFRWRQARDIVRDIHKGLSLEVDSEDELSDNGTGHAAGQ